MRKLVFTLFALIFLLSSPTYSGIGYLFENAVKQLKEHKIYNPQQEQNSPAPKRHHTNNKPKPKFRANNSKGIISTAPFKVFKVLRGHKMWVDAVAFSPATGANLASGGEDNTVRIWDAENWTLEKTISLNKDINSLVFSPGEAFLVVAEDDGYLDFIITARWKKAVSIKGEFKGHVKDVVSASFSSDVTYFAAMNYNTLIVWEFESGKVVRTFDLGGMGNAVTFDSKDPNTLYSDCYRNGKEHICVWNLASSNPVKVIGNFYQIKDLSLSRSGQELVVAHDAGVSVYKIKDKRITLLRQFRGESFRKALLVPHTNLLIAARDTNEGGPVVYVWDIEKGTLLGKISTEFGVRSISADPNGVFVALGSNGYVIVLKRKY